tara:strand:+ start:285 stop:647 length:363 start_codon:yes stop_codon:yes gene_type:complete
MKSTRVELNFKRINHKDRGVIHLSPEPGNYDFLTTPKIDFEKEERVIFICPYCDSDLTSKKNNKFAELKMMVNEIIYFEALFSTVHGDKRTYIITQDEVDTYGDAEADGEIHDDLEDFIL